MARGAHLDDAVPLLHPGFHGRPPCDTGRRDGRQEGQKDSRREPLSVPDRPGSAGGTRGPPGMNSPHGDRVVGSLRQAPHCSPSQGSAFSPHLEPNKGTPTCHPHPGTAPTHPEPPPGAWSQQQELCLCSPFLLLNTIQAKFASPKAKSERKKFP